jgi:hypothetical protein
VLIMVTKVVAVQCTPEQEAVLGSIIGEVDWLAATDVHFIRSDVELQADINIRVVPQTCRDTRSGQYEITWVDEPACLAATLRKIMCLAEGIVLPAAPFPEKLPVKVETVRRQSIPVVENSNTFRRETKQAIPKGRFGRKGSKK